MTGSAWMKSEVLAWMLGSVQVMAFSGKQGLVVERATALQREQRQTLEKDQRIQNYWPHVQGPLPGQFGTTGEVGPENIQEHLNWTWHHELGQYHTVVAAGPVIDSEKNIYLATTEGSIHKFSNDGKKLWQYKTPNVTNNGPTLLGEMVLGNDEGGHAFALNMTTGEPLWVRKYGENAGGDSGYPAAYKGMFIMGVDKGRLKNGGNERVISVNASTGDLLWEYRSEIPVWNFMPVFPGDDSVLFMDQSGGAHRLNLQSGKAIWHNPSPNSSGSFGDGGLMLGENKIAYTCSNLGTASGMEGEKGIVRAIGVDDGRTRWSKILPQPCNNYPTVGHVSDAGLSVVVNAGGFPGLPMMPKSPHHAGVFVLDAETGALQWQYQEAVYMNPAAKGDAEGLVQRALQNPAHPICLPAPWSSPAITGDGAIYLGHMSGLLHVLRGPRSSGFAKDEEALSKIDPETTQGVSVSSMDLGGAFLHGGTAWAPGMMAVTTCDTLYVFKF